MQKGGIRFVEYSKGYHTDEIKLRDAESGEQKEE
jgi:hypothetical protein